jgi:hypothetical protein
MYFNGKISSEALLLERKPDIAAGEYAFVVPNSTPGPLAGKQPDPALSANGSNPYALRARRALGQSPLWLGERFRGRRLEAVTTGTTVAPPTGNSPKAATYVFYDYGNVAISEFNAHDLHGAQGASLPGRMTLQRPDTLLSPSAKTFGRRATNPRRRVGLRTGISAREPCAESGRRAARRPSLRPVPPP